MLRINAWPDRAVGGRPRHPGRRKTVKHRANLALRFFLEIAALGGFGVLSWRLTDGLWRYSALIAVLAPLMALWGVFAVPGDPSRAGNAPVPVSGTLRLAVNAD